MVGEQYWLASAAQYLGVEQRFAKTVRLGTKMDGGGRPDAWATVKRYNKTYCARNVHVMLDDLVQKNLLCHTGSKEIAATKRSAVFDMAALHARAARGARRGRVAPKVVVLHQEQWGDPAAATSPRYLDECGHDVTPYLSECTTHLEGLQYSIAFGEDIHDDGSMEACRSVRVAAVLMVSVAALVGTLGILVYLVAAAAGSAICIRCTHGTAQHSSTRRHQTPKCAGCCAWIAAASQGGGSSTRATT